jgi:hypothetical protein
MSKNKEQEEKLSGRQLYQVFSHVYSSLHIVNYVSDYKSSYRS